MLHWSWFFFSFQAEDGIRDLVRSRGLGDVYKRQATTFENAFHCNVGKVLIRIRFALLCAGNQGALHAVSYTHLTLPTSDLV